MIEREDLGRRWKRWVINAIFAVILVIWFGALYSNLKAIQTEVSILFAASYILLGVGALGFYLLAGMNYRFASLVHVGLFPFLGIFYLFGRWVPDVIPRVEGIEGEFSLGILAYVFVLVVFLIVQLLLHLSEPEPERVRQFRRLAL